MNSLKQIVNAETFYQCPTKKAIRQKFHEESRMTVLYGIMANLGAALRYERLGGLYERCARFRYEWFAYDYFK